MTRINTNVSSLNAQKTLARSNAMLQESLTRLSTGLRINTGKDDPAGLIASEVLRSDIIGVQRAITNSQRANQMIATADSALGQVSSLLNDVRGLISEAANTGAMSAEQISANQLQIDSSLEAIDRIAQVTQFQGRRLLDGSLDFVTDGVESAAITDLKIDQANFGTQTEVGVAIEVVEQATRAELNYELGAIADDVVLEIGGKNGFEAFNFAGGSTIEDLANAINLVADALGIEAEVQTEATKGSINVSSFGANNDIVLTASTAGFDAGNIRVKYTADPTGNATLKANYTAPGTSDSGILEIELETQAWKAAEYTYFTNDATGDNALKMVAAEPGAAYNGWNVEFNAVAGGGIAGANDAVAWNDASKTITLTRDTGGAAVLDVTAEEYRVLAMGDDRFAEMFTMTHTDGSLGSGVVRVNDAGGGADVDVDATTAQATATGGVLGVEGGAILTTANQVVALINAETDLKDDVVASLGEGNDGYGTVTAFQESAYYGSAAADNGLQFLGAENAPNIRFVSNSGDALGVDLSTAPKVEGFATSIVNLGVDKGTIRITARTKGGDYDDVDIKFAPDTGNGQGNGFAVWDAKDKELVIHADLGVGADTVDDVVSYINNTAGVKDLFLAATYGTADGSADVPNSPVEGKTVGTTSGGLVSEGTVIVKLATDANGTVTTTAQDLVDFFDDPANTATLSDLAISVANLEGSDGSGLLAATEDDMVFATTGTTTSDANATALVNTSGGINSMFTITADVAGAAFEGVKIEFEGTATAAGSETVSYDATSKTLTIGIEDGVTNANQVITAINDTVNNPEIADLFSADVAKGIYGTATDSDGLGKIYITDGATLTGGTATTGTATGAAFIGNADEANTGLTFKAIEFGSDAFVSVRALNGSTFKVTDKAGVSASRVVGTDVDARINGIQAVGKGLTAALNTSALDLTFTLAEAVQDGDSQSFRIVGGGAQFQLGPDVVSNQQARLGISSVNTAKLGGVAGRLFELRSGGAKDLENNVISAAMVIEEVITQVTTLRGRLGAFQRTTLETNIASLADTLEALTEAESSIRDADFAQESAGLTRNQILVQSGISVLTIANQNPEAVLSLLR